MTKISVSKDIRVIVADIEGTTTATSFMHDTLSPYAKNNLHNFMMDNKDNPVIHQVCENVRIDAKLPQISVEAAMSILKIWMEQNQLFHSLKILQGLIWEQGFNKKIFEGHIFEDVYRHVKKWKSLGIPLYLFSHDSAHSQKLLLKHSNQGNMTSFCKGYFDLSTGCKTSPLSYKKIAEQLNFAPKDILFLSDCLDELDAAKTSGLKTGFVHRRCNNPPLCPHPTIKNFDEILYVD